MGPYRGGGNTPTDTVGCAEGGGGDRSFWTRERKYFPRRLILRVDYHLRFVSRLRSDKGDSGCTSPASQWLLSGYFAVSSVWEGLRAKALERPMGRGRGKGEGENKGTNAAASLSDLGDCFI